MSCAPVTFATEVCVCMSFCVFCKVEEAGLIPMSQIKVSEKCVCVCVCTNMCVCNDTNAGVTFATEGHCRPLDPTGKSKKSQSCAGERCNVSEKTLIHHSAFLSCVALLSIRDLFLMFST
jgi:hypothetical protein